MFNQYIEITIDKHIRTMFALLAASNWPSMEQTITPHAVHPHSKQTMHYLQPYKNHAAVIEINAALDAGGTLANLFKTAVSHNKPHQKSAILDFAITTNLAAFWDKHATVWGKAVADLQAIFNNKPILKTIAALTNIEIKKPVQLMPTIVYPMLTPVVFENTEHIFIILPPAKAWGESPPWPFGNDPGWAMAQVIFYLSQYLLRDSLTKAEKEDALVRLHAIVVLCLEKELNDAEAMAYLVRTKKEQNLPQLMAAVEAMR